MTTNNNSTKWIAMTEAQRTAKIEREAQTFLTALTRRDNSRSGSVIEAMDERMERVADRIEALGPDAWNTFLKRVHP